MKKRVILDFTLGEGWLLPWLAGLREGTARASECVACDVAYFPPLKRCPTCRCSLEAWRTLSGKAAVLSRTSGTDGDFAFVQFEGATGAAIVRADGLPAGTINCVLVPCMDDPPTPVLKAERDA